MDIAVELSSDVPKPQPTRKLRRRGEQLDQKPKKQKTVGPPVVHALTEAEVVEDLFLIKRSFPNANRRNPKLVNLKN